MSSSKVLARNYSNAVFAGVCTGLSDYFGIGVLYIRLIFVIATAVSGWGVIVYLLLLFVLPYKSEEGLAVELRYDFCRYNIKSVTGTVFVFIGSYFVFKRLGAFSYFWFIDPSSSLLLPVIFLFVGIKIMQKKLVVLPEEKKTDKNLERINNGKRLMGVCAGLSEYLNADATIVRMLFVFSVFATVGITFFIYLLLSIMLPLRKEEVYAD